MGDMTAFLRWLFEYAFSGGFWHFVGVYLLIVAITRISTLARISISRKAKKSGKANV